LVPPAVDGPGRDRERRLAVALVTVQAGLLLAFFAVPHRRDWPLPGWLEAAGSVVTTVGGVVLVVAALNLGRSLTPLPTPATSGTLRTGGLYRFVRHPIYSGLLALVFGGAVTSRSAIRLVLAGALLALLTRKAAWEEAMLRRRYPGYDEYARRTPRFLPRVVRREVS
jgi:protein-S-isoprenylcysteine O-methyltransferase Ste14